MQKILTSLTILVILLTFGCAQRPVLYPNEHYNEVGASAGEQDVEECIAMAEAADLDTNQTLEAGSGLQAVQWSAAQRAQSQA